MIYVTHDQVEAMTLADKIVVLDRGEISQVGTPLELYNSPANKFVASFIGSPAMNFFDAQLQTVGNGAAAMVLPGGNLASVRTRGGKAPSGTLEIGVRPEHLKIVNPGDKAASFNGTISIVEQLGNSTILYVDTAAGQLVVEGEGSLEATSGETVGLMMDPRHTHLFGPDARAV